jgi:hypothetical protein
MHCTIVSLELQLAAPFSCWKTLYLKVIIRSDMEFGVMPGSDLCLLQVKLVWVAMKVFFKSNKTRLCIHKASLKRL